MGEKKVEYILYDKRDSKKLSTLIEVYKKNPYAARVMFFNGSKHEFTSSRLVKFQNENGDFEITRYVKHFGISVTNRMYSREKKESSIIYSKKKFYFKHDKRLTQLTCNGLLNFIQSWQYSDDYSKTKIVDDLVKDFSWIRFIIENEVLHSTAFNTFIRYKLYNLNDALRHIFKCPLPVIKVLTSKNGNGSSLFHGHASGLSKHWKNISKSLKNVENLRMEMIQHHLFQDACRMARILDKKVNCSWSLKRLTEEHDKWSREITFIVLSNEPVSDLIIKEVYREFAEYSGYRLLTTNIDMLGEGMIQNHCVGTYIHKVNRGQCAIYHIEGYTLEARFSTYWDEKVRGFTKENVFHNGQFRGRKNESAPPELEARVNKKMEEFNEILKERKYAVVDTDTEVDFEW